ncbi:hypothetical protein HYX16_01265 [Candidatus Woesearchaeota archaeon]|nr:hypothetical protein [Candidatus Woesearchaeota archaeon]
MGKLKITKYLFYLGLLIIAVWALLKITGIVQTPLWFEIGLPTAGFIITMLSFYQDLYRSMNKIYQDLSKDINKIAINVSILNTKFEHLDKDVEFLKRKTI